MSDRIAYKVIGEQSRILLDKEKSIVVNISGRGDKDINTVADLEGIEI